MKSSVLALLPLLASVVVGRPSKLEDEGDPLPQTSRVTAFMIDENGNPTVECWELSNMVNDMTIQRRDGSHVRAYSMTLAKGGELEGLDILTWPAASPIWPDPSAIEDGVRADWLDLSNSFNLFNVQGGLINFKLNVFAAQNFADLPEHTFSLENGDDWFYFEDKYTNSDASLRTDAAEPPVTFGTVSASETEVMRLRFPKRPSYKVLHKGGCDFTGVSTPSESSSSRYAHPRNTLRQQQIEQL